jgi:hypothetical protein
VVFMQIQILGVFMLCRRIRNSGSFKASLCLHLVNQAVQEEWTIFLDCLTLKMTALQSFETQVTTEATTQCKNPDVMFAVILLHYWLQGYESLISYTNVAAKASKNNRTQSQNGYEAARHPVRLATISARVADIRDHHVASHKCVQASAAHTVSTVPVRRQTNIK